MIIIKHLGNKCNSKVGINVLKYKSSNKYNFKIGTKGSAGIDLFCNETKWIMPFTHAKINLGVAFELPKNTVGFLTGRSSTRIKKGIEVVNGIIDSDYRGEISAVFVNNSIVPRKVKSGERLVQLIMMNIVMPYELDIKKTNELSVSDRNENGFGSTGERN